MSPTLDAKKEAPRSSLPDRLTFGQHSLACNPRSRLDPSRIPVARICPTGGLGMWGRLRKLDVAGIPGSYVPILVEHIASGRFGNLEKLQVTMHSSIRDPSIMTPVTEWSIRPLGILSLIGVSSPSWKILVASMCGRCEQKDFQCWQCPNSFKEGGFKEIVSLNFSEGQANTFGCSWRRVKIAISLSIIVRN
jgi:hypothetical protein